MRNWIRKWLGIEEACVSGGYRMAGIERRYDAHIERFEKHADRWLERFSDLEERLKVTEAYSAELASRILILERAQADAKQAPRAQTMTGIRRSIGQMGGLKDEVLTR